MNNNIPASNNAKLIDINNGEAFSAEIKKLTIQIISNIEAMTIVINATFLNLLSILADSTILIYY